MQNTQQKTKQHKTHINFNSKTQHKQRQPQTTQKQTLTKQKQTNTQIKQKQAAQNTTHSTNNTTTIVINKHSKTHKQ